MITFDEATSRVLARAQATCAEWVPIGQAKDRILAEPLIAKRDSPPRDVAAMDGYAVREADLSHLPAELAVQGAAFAGAVDEVGIDPRCCLRIFTGAPIPVGADRVVVQEAVRRLDATAMIDVHPGKSLHIRRLGSDFRRGDVLLQAGQRLHYRALTVAAAADVSELRVWAQPRIALLSTGDELVAPGLAAARPGAVPESLSVGLAALIGDHGGDVVAHLQLPDDLPTMKRQAAEAGQGADLIVVTGGASIGDKDHARQMFDERGLDLIFSKVAMKPGKPVWLGRVGTTLVFGVPGNPMSALVTARLLLAPLVAGLAGRDPRQAVRWRSAPVGTGLEPVGDRETFVRARWDGDSAEPLANQESGAQRVLAEADLLLRRRANAPALEMGDLVEAVDF